jgi:hypothetical protein
MASSVGMASRLRLIAAAAAWAFAAQGAAAQTEPAQIPPEQAARVLQGLWDVTLKSPLRSCRVELKPTPAAQGLAAVINPRCRWAILPLKTAAAWSLGEGNRPDFIDAKGAVVMRFSRAVASTLIAKVGETEDYVMEPVASGSVADNDRRAAVAALFAGRPLPPDPSKLAPVDPKTVPGNYGVAREKGRPICSITLSSRPARAGAYGAEIAGGCLDAGLKIFDPVAWRIDRGRLVLIAKKGHETAFVPMSDGTWSKDPVGTSPMFLKMQ